MLEYRYTKQYACCTEQEMAFGKADVFAVDKKGFTTEFEVKVNRQDFKSELYSIKSVVHDLELQTRLMESWGHEWQESVFPNKYKKHQCYLKTWENKNPKWGSIVSNPNKFYFVITQELFEKVDHSILSETPYGLIVIDDNVYRSQRIENWSMKIIKPAKQLHTEPFDFDLLYRFSKRCSANLITLFSKNL